MSRLFDLAGKVAVVSGASRGIGQAIAEGLAAHGAEVVVSSRRLDACEIVAERIRAAGGKARAQAAHAGKLEDIDALFDFVDRVFGRIDILVNCGATNPYYGPIGGTEPSVFDKTVEVNLRGPFFMSSKAVERMKTSGGGSIINIASINARRPGFHQGIYSMTKAALVNMTKAFALEYGADNIRVNALLPGLTETKLASAMTQNEAVLGRFLKTVPLGRVAQPEEMVGAVVYLASDAASYTTGLELVVDGGVTI